VVPVQSQVQYRESGPVNGAFQSRRHEVGPWSQFNPRSSTGSPGRLTEQFLLAGRRRDRGPSYIPGAVPGVRAGLPEQFRLAGTRWDRGPSSISGAVPGVRAGLPERFCITDRRWDRGPSSISGAVPAVRARLPERFCLTDGRWDHGPSSIQSTAWRSGPGYRMIYATQKGDEMIALDWKK
jgi:hypothetical protein